jgi:hypothetical protein
LKAPTLSQPTATPLPASTSPTLRSEEPAIRHGSFDSVKQLVAAIGTFIEGWNDRCHPFTWTKTADEILPHATRKRDSDARH